MTTLGSNLTCTEQTATLEDRGQIEILWQNFGFDLDAGIKTVELEAETEHYFLTVRRAGFITKRLTIDRRGNRIILQIPGRRFVCPLFIWSWVCYANWQERGEMETWKR